MASKLASDTRYGSHGDLPLCTFISGPALSIEKSCIFSALFFIRTKIMSPAFICMCLHILFLARTHRQIPGNSGRFGLPPNVAVLFGFWVRSRKTLCFLMLGCHGVHNLGIPGALTTLFNKRKNTMDIHLPWSQMLETEIVSLWRGS